MLEKMYSLKDKLREQRILNKVKVKKEKVGRKKSAKK